MNLKEIRSELDVLVNDDSYDPIALDGFINKALAYSAGLVDLPSLKRIGNISTVVDQAYVDVLDTYSTFSISRLKRVKTASGNSPNIYSNLWALMDAYPEMDEEGDVEAIAVEGSYIWYQKIPAAEENLLLGYMVEPSQLLLDENIPSDFPAFLHRSLFVHGAAWMIFNEKEEDVESQKFNAKSHFWLSFEEANKASGITKLQEWLSKTRRNNSYGMWDY